MQVLIQALAQILQKKHWQLVTAESCTGGLIASYLTEVPGSSLWFERGFVSYSNQAKQDMLAVPQALITSFGAVSEEVAAAMASGALSNSQGQCALAVTGIAGPGGGSLAKPVGTVCFGWALTTEPPNTTTKQFSGTRQAIREATCLHSLQGLLSLLMQQ